MAYTKNPTWVDGAAGGTLIDAAHLNHMEDGIQAAAATADAAIPAAQKGAASGVASLDATGKVPAAQIPATADATTTSKGIVQLAGDLAGTAASPTVPGLTSRIPTSTVTTKGDLIVGTAASAVSRQGAGADGTVLTADSTQATGVRWATPSGGASALPFVWAYRSTDQSYSSSSLTTINWNAEAEDASGFHDNVSNPDRLTVPSGQGGLYQLSFTLKLSGTSIGASAISVKKNGTTVLPDITSPVSGATAFGGSALLRLAAADYLSLQIYTNAGTSLLITGGATESTGSTSFVQLVRLGS